MCLCIHSYIYRYIYMYIHTHIYTCVHVHVQVHVYVYKYICVYICIYFCVCLCVCMYVCMYVFLYEYVLTYTFILFTRTRICSHTDTHTCIWYEYIHTSRCILCILVCMYIYERTNTYHHARVPLLCTAYLYTRKHNAPKCCPHGEQLSNTLAEWGSLHQHIAFWPPAGSLCVKCADFACCVLLHRWSKYLCIGQRRLER